MKLRSLSAVHNVAGLSLFSDVAQELLNASGQIRRIDIATAYTDTDALANLLALVDERGDRRSGAKVRIFLDYQSTCKLVDELQEDQCDFAKTLHDSLMESTFRAKSRA